MPGGLTAVAGLVICIGAILYGISQTGQFGAFVNMPSVFIVVVGATGATIASFTFRQFVSGMKSMKDIFVPKTFPYASTISQFREMAGLLRREGPMGLQTITAEDELMEYGVDLILGGTAESATLEQQLRPKLDVIRREAASNQEILGKMGSYAPAFGMAGTLIGLVAMLTTLDDPGSIGPKMAVALITTLYGVLVANMICIPLSSKITENTNAELSYKQMIVEGMVNLLEAPDPDGLVDQLIARVPLSQVAEVQEAVEQAAGAAA